MKNGIKRGKKFQPPVNKPSGSADHSPVHGLTSPFEEEKKIEAELNGESDIDLVINFSQLANDAQENAKPPKTNNTIR